jgi:hypothetical protein
MKSAVLCVTNVRLWTNSYRGDHQVDGVHGYGAHGGFLKQVRDQAQQSRRIRMAMRSGIQFGQHHGGNG